MSDPGSATDVQMVRVRFSFNNFSERNNIITKVTTRLQISERAQKIVRTRAQRTSRARSPYNTVRAQCPVLKPL